VDRDALGPHLVLDAPVRIVVFAINPKASDRARDRFAPARRRVSPRCAGPGLVPPDGSPPSESAAAELRGGARAQGPHARLCPPGPPANAAAESAHGHAQGVLSARAGAERRSEARVGARLLARLSDAGGGRRAHRTPVVAVGPRPALDRRARRRAVGRAPGPAAARPAARR